MSRSSRAISARSSALSLPSSPTCCNWSVSSGALPPGLILGSVINTQNTIGGTPTAAGTFNFSINASDAGHNTIPPQAYTVIISPALGISPASLPAGQQSAIYSVSISATNGIPPYGALQLTGTLPNGLTFTSGSLSGIPTQAGTFPLTATVTDSVGGSASVNYNLSISPPPIVTTLSVPQGEVTAAYSTTLAETGGTGPTFTWSLASGSLPNGVSLAASGVISGTPTQAGSFPFSVQVTDNAAVTSAPQALTLTVIAGPTITTGATLPSGEAAAPYSQTLAASGGTNSGFTWTVTSGSLPPGLSLNSGVAITGTPTTVGSFSFTAKVTDSGGGSATRAFALSIIGGPTITTAPALPSGVQPRNPGRFGRHSCLRLVNHHGVTAAGTIVQRGYRGH